MSPRTPLLVGLVLVMAVSGLTWFMMGTRKNTFDEKSTYLLYADFQDASGIRGKTRLQINGIDVGHIVSIGHVRTPQGHLTARVGMRILKIYGVYSDAKLRKVAESLLGDFRLDLDPGTPQGSKLKSGDVIACVDSLSDLDAIKSQLLQVSRNVNDVTESFSKVLAGPEGEGSLKAILSKVENSMGAIEETTQALRHTISGSDAMVSQIIQDMGRISKTLVHISKPGGDVRSMAHHLASLSQKLDAMADQISSLLGPPAGVQTSDGVSGGHWDVYQDGADLNPKSVQQTLVGLNQAADHLLAITRKIDAGHGTLGRLINDSSIAERVESTLESTQEILGNLANIETQIELRSEYDVPFNGNNNQIQAAIKNTIGLRILPKPDKYYILEAIADPRGRQTRTLTTALIGGENPKKIRIDQTIIAFNALKFSAQFAKRYDFLTLRFGLIENTGGLGFNLHTPGNRGELRLDAYDFDRRSISTNQNILPRLRATLMYEVANHVFVQAGFDDPLNRNLRTWFLGGALRFTDDDLKAFLTIAPRR